MLNSNYLKWSLSGGTIFLLFSCSSPKVAPAVKAPQVSHEQLKTECEQKSIALSCARYGYLTKDLAYTRQACYLGDQNACFNVQEIENRAPNQNFAIINAHQGQIYGCYVNNSIDEDNGEGVKNDKNIELVFLINSRGELASLSVIGETLSQKFKDCVMSSFTSKRFIAVDREQSIRYELSMPAVTRDRRLKGKRPGYFD